MTKPTKKTKNIYIFKTTWKKKKPLKQPKKHFETTKRKIII